MEALALEIASVPVASVLETDVQRVAAQDAVFAVLPDLVLVASESVGSYSGAEALQILGEQLWLPVVAQQGPA